MYVYYFETWTICNWIIVKLFQLICYICISWKQAHNLCLIPFLNRHSHQYQNTPLMYIPKCIHFTHLHIHIVGIYLLLWHKQFQNKKWQNAKQTINMYFSIPKCPTLCQSIWQWGKGVNGQGREGCEKTTMSYTSSRYSLIRSKKACCHESKALLFFNSVSMKIDTWFHWNMDIF